MLRERSLGSVKILSVDYKALMASLAEASSEIKRKHPHVEKIFLFGSFSRGNYTPCSDIDILIIVKDTEKPFLLRSQQFAGYFPVPFDVNILVYTSKEFEKMLEEKNQFLINILQDARELKGV